MMSPLRTLSVQSLVDDWFLPSSPSFWPYSRKLSCCFLLFSFFPVLIENKQLVITFKTMSIWVFSFIYKNGINLFRLTFLLSMFIFIACKQPKVFYNVYVSVMQFAFHFMHASKRVWTSTWWKFKQVLVLVVPFCKCSTCTPFLGFL